MNGLLLSVHRILFQKCKRNKKKMATQNAQYLITGHLENVRFITNARGWLRSSASLFILILCVAINRCYKQICFAKIATTNSCQKFRMLRENSLAFACQVRNSKCTCITAHTSAFRNDFAQLDNDGNIPAAIAFSTIKRFAIKVSCWHCLGENLINSV